MSQDEFDVLLKFLEYTRDGLYSPIEESSLLYARIKEERDFVEIYEEDYYYSIS